MAAASTATANEYLAQHPDMIKTFFTHIVRDAVTRPGDGLSHDIVRVGVCVPIRPQEVQDGLPGDVSHWP